MIKILATVLFLTFLLSSKFCPAQKQKKLFAKYEFNSTAKPNGDTTKFALYYIIDSANRIMHDGEIYYAFTFSTDANALDGYVFFDKKQKTMFFISKYYKDTVQCTHANRKQVLFSFSNSNWNKLCYVGFLGSPSKIILMKKNRNKKQSYLMRIAYDMRPPSNTYFVQSMYFEDYLCPERITFFDPFLNKSIVVICKK